LKLGQLTCFRRVSFDKDTKTSDAPVVEIQEPVDEAKLIEERRKKREAIKAKYRGQGTPSLAAALGAKETPALSPANTTDPNSPSESTSGMSTGLTNCAKGTPRSPRDFTPGGDFNIVKDGAAKEHEQGGEEPSAADYDPTLDMREDQRRNEARLHKNEVSSDAYDEMKSTDRDVLMREADAPHHEPPKPEKLQEDDDFDMFAEGDDDDMFAPVAPIKKETAKAIPIIEAKQLDAGMMLDNWDDEEGYYKMIPGELLDGRYKVQMSLGKGMFSGVVRARDIATGKDSAIKIIRNNETMYVFPRPLWGTRTADNSTYQAQSRNEGDRYSRQNCSCGPRG
jgi:serine/threonine-protein kinase PRP4